jgi:hypothetical protein
MRHKRVIVIVCGLLAAAAVLAGVLARSRTSHQLPIRVASVRLAASGGICSTAKRGCVSGCLLPIAAVTPAHARAGECAPATRSTRPCRLLISSDQHTPGTTDDSFCSSDEVLFRQLRKERAKPSPQARR